MILIGDNDEVHQIFSRNIVGLSSIYAEIGISKYEMEPETRSLIKPSTIIEDETVGKLVIDSVKTLADSFVLNCYDPLNFYARHHVCSDVMETTDVWSYPTDAATGDSLVGIVSLLTTFVSTKIKDKFGISILSPPEKRSKDSTRVDVRYDKLFDVLNQIIISSPHTRLRISYDSASGITMYQPEEYDDQDVIPLNLDYCVDFSMRMQYPNVAWVAGTGEDIAKHRNTSRVGDVNDIYDTFVDSRFSGNVEAILQATGKNALEMEKAKATNITIKCLHEDLPDDLYPGQSVEIDNGDTYTVFAIQTAPSAGTGEIAYLTLGGRAMTMSERIDAILATDLMGRY